MTSAPTSSPTFTRRRRGWALIALFALAAAGGGTWWYARHREPIPDPPAPDLSRADPEVAQAVTDAAEAVRQKPRDAAAWGQLGMVLRAHDFEPECVTAFHTAARLDPSDYRWPYLEGITLIFADPDRGLERLRRAADVAPKNSPEPRLRLAKELFERGEWQAVIDYTDGCADDPGCAGWAAKLRGDALSQLGQPDRAAAEYRRATPGGWPTPLVDEVESLRVDTTGRLRRADALLGQGRVNDAVALLTDLVRRNPTKPDPALKLGRLLVELNDPGSARSVLADLTARVPDSVEGWFLLGVAQAQLGETAPAADSFRHVIRLKPDHALAHFNLGHCYRKLGDRAAARSEYEEALRCRPDHEPSRQSLTDLDAGK